MFWSIKLPKLQSFCRICWDWGNKQYFIFGQTVPYLFSCSVLRNVMFTRQRKAYCKVMHVLQTRGFSGLVNLLLGLLGFACYQCSCLCIYKLYYHMNICICKAQTFSRPPNKGVENDFNLGKYSKSTYCIPIKS